jgi:hypothetical protein
MKKALRALFAFTTLAVFATLVPAFAADTEPMHVNVPFAFKAGKTTLPAGQYTVYSDESRVIMIKGTHGSAILLGTAGADSAGDKSGVSFERDATGYCLKTIHNWGKMSSTRVLEPSTFEDK